MHLLKCNESRVNASFHLLIVILSILLPGQSRQLTLQEEFLFQRCNSQLQDDSDLFFFTYIAQEHGCTLNCYWFRSQMYPGFLDTTVKRTFYNNGYNCLDGGHICTYGECVSVNSNLNVTTTAAPVSKYGRIFVEIRDGYFNVQDGNSKGDPYVRFYHKGKLYSTSVKKNTWLVRFNEEFNLPGTFSIDDTLKLTVMDKDDLSDDKIGDIYIKLRDIHDKGNNGKVVQYPVGAGMDYLNVRITWLNQY